MMLQSCFLQTMFIQKTRGTQNVFIRQFPLKAHHFPLKSYNLFIFYSFFLFSAVRKKAQNGTNGKKDIYFGLIFCFQKTVPVKTYFFAWSKLGAFGVILTMQLEPPKSMFVSVHILSYLLYVRSDILTSAYHFTVSCFACSYHTIPITR